MSTIVSYDYQKVIDFVGLASSRMGNVCVSVVVFDTILNEISASYIGLQSLPDYTPSYSEVVICHISYNDHRKTFPLGNGYMFVNGTIVSDDYQTLSEVIYSNPDYRFNFVYVDNSGIYFYTKVADTLFTGFEGDVLLSTALVESNLLSVPVNIQYKIDFENEILVGGQ